MRHTSDDLIATLAMLNPDHPMVVVSVVERCPECVTGAHSPVRQVWRREYLCEVGHTWASERSIGMDEVQVIDQSQPNSG